MKAVILAAGFATRLRPLSNTTPKALLKVRDSYIIDDVVQQLFALFPDPTDRALITNHHYYSAFQDWLNREQHPPLQLVDNGVRTTKDKIGSIGDLLFALDHLGWQQEDVLVVASDTLTSLRLRDFLRTFKQNSSVLNAVIDLKDPSLIAQKLGCVQLKDNQIVGFEEKPTHPKSTYVSIPFYCFPKEAYLHIVAFVQSGQSLDTSGSLLAYLVQHLSVTAHKVEQGFYYDVGTPKILELLQTKQLRYR